MTLLDVTCHFKLLNDRFVWETHKCWTCYSMKTLRYPFSRLWIWLPVNYPESHMFTVWAERTMFFRWFHSVTFTRCTAFTWTLSGALKWQNYWLLWFKNGTFTNCNWEFYTIIKISFIKKSSSPENEKSLIMCSTSWTLLNHSELLPLPFCS